MPSAFSAQKGLTMFMRSFIFSVVAAGATATAIAIAVPAYALSTVAVKAGSAPSGTSVALGFASSAAVQSKDLSTNFTFSCSSSSLTGTTKAGPNSPPNLAQINGGAGQVHFVGCSTLGIPLTINGVGTTKWTVAATANSASGTTPVNITGVNFAFDSTSCSFNVTGSAAGSFVNGNPSRLTIPATTATTSRLVVGNLVLKSGATKCLAGGFRSGDKISLSVSYNVTATTAAYNPVTATAS